MSSIDKIAKERLAKKDPFEKLSRDLPKGGRAIGVAEDLVAGPAEKAVIGAMKRKGAGKMLRNAAITGGLAIPATIAMEGLDAESASSPEELAAEKNIGGIARAERDAVDPASLPLKGNPEMIPYGAKIGGSREKQILQRFQEEGKKNISPDFSVDVPVDYTDEGTGENEKFIYNLKSKKPISELNQMKAIGNDAIMGRTGGKIKLPVKSKSGVLITEEDEED